MKYQFLSILLLITLLFGFGTLGCVPPTGETPEETDSTEAVVTTMPTIEETVPCIGFREYIASHNFGNPWEFQEFIFTSTTQLVVKSGANNINGLNLEATGLRVELPGVTENVTIQAMAMGNVPITIDALDGSKNLVDTVQVPDDDILHTVYLSAEEISTVIFTEGDNEALLIEICMGEFYTQ